MLMLLKQPQESIALPVPRCAVSVRPASMDDLPVDFAQVYLSANEARVRGGGEPRTGERQRSDQNGKGAE